MGIAVIIATYGDEAWRDLAMSRAYPSAVAAGANPDLIFGMHEYGEAATLARARNAGARSASGGYTPAEWFCFLDADDELAPGYLDAMERALHEMVVYPRSLLVPRVQYVRGGRYDRVKWPRTPSGEWPPRENDIENGNWMVIGTLIQRELFWEIGGFEEWPMYEDWALFARAMKAGAIPLYVPDAIYVAHLKPRSRNHQGRNAALAAHDAIRRVVFPELYEQAS